MLWPIQTRLPETLKQAEALDAAMAKRIDNVTFKCFPAMRYWRPFVRDVAKAAEAWGATDVILLPLYPQFSTTTTASSFAVWKRASKLPASTICCYPAGQALAQAHADAILETWRPHGGSNLPRSRRGWWGGQRPPATRRVAPVT